MIQLNLTVENTNLVLAALAELPAKVSMGLIFDIQQQAGPQVAPTPAAEPEPEVTPAPKEVTPNA